MLVQGEIEALSIKPLAKPDNYDNLFRLGFKVGDHWYSAGSLKKQEWNVKKDNKWYTVGKGSEIAFTYVQNGDFRNVKRGDIIFVEIVESDFQPQGTQSGTQSPQSGGSGHNPAEIGQIMNLAVQAYGIDNVYSELDIDFIKLYYAVRNKVEGLVKLKDTADQVQAQQPKQGYAHALESDPDLSENDPFG